MPADTTSQYLTFKLSNDVFAIDISRVREVLDFTETTKIPRTPPFMIGVINLRGNIVPVVDLRQNLGMSATKTTADTCIVIIEIAHQADALVVGALADTVQEVLEIPPTAIEGPPKIGTKIKPEYLKGIGKHRDTFVMILNMDNVLSEAELDFADSTTMSSEDAAEALEGRLSGS